MALAPVACVVLPKAKASLADALAELPTATAFDPPVVALEPNAIESVAAALVRAFVPNARERAPSVTVLVSPL